MDASACIGHVEFRDKPRLNGACRGCHRARPVHLGHDRMLVTKLTVWRPGTVIPYAVRGATTAVSFTTLLIWLLRWAQPVSPRIDLHGSFGRLRFVMLGLRNRAALNRFVKAPDDGPLARAVRSRPQMLRIVLHAYQTTAWNLPTRLENLLQHYEELAALDLPDLLDPEASLEIMALPEITPRLRLVLDQAPWFCAEGPLVLNLFDGEERLYSLAFALSRQDGIVTTQVGAIQGRALPEIMDVYRQLTRATHGLRPRDLLIELFRLFCADVGINRILLVSDSHRQHRDTYFGSAADKVKTDYDTIWRDRGAYRLDEGTFELPLHGSRRSAGDVPPRKRALYQRRYALLDLLAGRMVQRIAAIRGASVAPGHGCERV